MSIPDPIEMVVGILSDALDATVSTEMPGTAKSPASLPCRYVMVALAGDMSTELLLMPRMALTCWGTSDRDAHSLAVSAWQALAEAATEHPLLSSCQLETMSRDEWGNTGASRYFMELDLTINV